MASTTEPAPVSAHDRRVLRDLARQVRDIADQPIMAERRRRWVRHNTLQPERPMVLCFPEGGTQELIPPTACQCDDPALRKWEYTLRWQVFWWRHINDDNFIEPVFNLNWQVRRSGLGVDVPLIHGDNRGSYTWDPPLKDLAHDLDRLHHQSFEVDRDATLRDLQRAREIFGDILPCRIHGSLYWSTGLTQQAAFLVGMEQLMWAMVDQPEHVHRLMTFLRDDWANFLDWAERENLFSSNTGGDYVGSGGVGAIDDAFASDTEAFESAPLGQRWGFAESQETVGISPAMFDEFVLPYQVPLLERTALNCYGCCEGLEHRLDLVLKYVPRLRRISIAPSADQERIALKIAGRYVYSRKPYPGHVCVGFNEDAIRQDLRRTLALSGGKSLEFILKDTHTFEHDATRPGRWVAIAREEIDRYMDQAA